jgi:two-component system, sensor histidine kinase PdtaS
VPGALPPLLVEVGIGVLLPVLFVLLRLSLVPFANDRAPFAFVFLAVVGAAVLAGWRSGLIALVAGQLLTWYFVMEPAWSFAIPDAQRASGLILATASEALILIIISLYQREVDRAWAARERQMELLDKALKEIDHRTSNNYQTVLALVLAQARGTGDEQARQALQQVADRIRAIASASATMAFGSEKPEDIRLGPYLQEICEQIEKGLFRPGIRLDCDLADVTAKSEQASAVSIIVNELVTNALKHAFPDERDGVVHVRLRRSSGDLELEIEDDGVGIGGSARGRGSGLGNRLIATFTKQLRARHEVVSGADGTRHRLVIPTAGAPARSRPAK